MKCNPLIALVLLMWAWPAFAQTTQPTINLSTDIEDGKKMIHATVALNGKPMENIALQYFVKRTFGELAIGQDTTLDDGSSAVAFPSDLPGGPDGKIDLIVRIKTPAQYAATSATATFAADVQPAIAPDPFPRALWAPNAPLSLMLSIFAILAGVWLSYLFVVGQILAIRTGGK